MKKMLNLCAVGLLLVSILLCGVEKNAYAQPMNEDVLAVIRVNNLNDLLMNIGQLVDKVQPGMGAMINPMMVGQMIFANPGWTGMDITEEYKVIVLNPMLYAGSPFAIIAPLSDNDTYLNLLSQSLQVNEEADGIYNFMWPTQQNMFVAFTEKAAILSANEDSAMQVKTFVEERKQVIDEIPDVEGQLRVFFPVKKILTTFRPVIDLMLGVMQQDSEENEQETEGMLQFNADTWSDSLEQTLAKIISLLGQLQKLYLGVNIQPEGIKISTKTFALKDTPFSDFIAVQKPQRLSMLKTLSPNTNAHVLFSFAIDTSTDPEWLESFYSMYPEANSTLIRQLQDMGFTIFEGAGVAGLSDSEGESLIILIADNPVDESDALKQKMFLKQNPEEAREMVKEFISQMFLTDMFTASSLNIEFDKETVEEIKFKDGYILNYYFGIKETIITLPSHQKNFEKFLGKGLFLQYGFIDKYAIVATGKKSLGHVKRIMTSLNNNSNIGAEHLLSKFEFPTENNIFAYISFPKILEWVTKDRTDVQQVKSIESPGVGICGRFTDSTFETEIFVPIDEILAIREMYPPPQ